MAVASSNRSAEVAEVSQVTRQDINFRGHSKVLPLGTNFIGKNQGQKHAPSSIQTPNLPGSRLCSNKAVMENLEATNHSREPGLFMHPVSGKSLNADQVSYWLANAVNWVFPDAMGRPMSSITYL